MAARSRGVGSRSRRAEAPEEFARPRRGRTLPILLAVVIGVVGVVALLLVPIGQSTAMALTVRTPGSTTQTYETPESFPRAGTYVFSWKANDTSGTFTIRESGHTPFFSTFNATGSLNLAVETGLIYDFGLLDSHPATLSISGSLHYAAPIL